MRRLLAHVALVVGGIAAALVPFACAELALRALGVGASLPRHDPFAGFSRVLPLFEPAQRADGTPVFRLSPARQLAAIGRVADEPQREFLQQKPPGTFRIFVVGDSSAAGVPYGTRYAFSSWLADELRAELPDVRFEVVNAAVPGYASRRVLTAVDELAAREPDLLVVYVGHNEFAERRFYAHLLGLDPRLFRLGELLVGTRLYGLIASLRGAEPEPPKLDPAEEGQPLQMFAVLRGRADGSSPYPSAREIAWGENHYRFNLEQMTRRMRAVGARVLIVGQAQNFADWAPGASEHGRTLTPEESARWDAELAEGRRLAVSGDCEAALRAFDRARAIDADYAELVFEQARCERMLGRYDAARASYRRASDLDRVPHGAPTAYNAIAREVAESEGALYVDADAALERVSGHALVGDPLFVDFVHPKVEAQIEIAAAIADALRAAGVPAPPERWQTQRWRPPDLAALYRDDPELVTQEGMMHAFTCLLADRDACALADAEAVLARDPDNARALGLRDRLRSGRSWP